MSKRVRIAAITIAAVFLAVTAVISDPSEPRVDTTIAAKAVRLPVPVEVTITSISTPMR